MKFELKKIMTSKTILIALVIAIAAFIFLTYNYFKTYTRPVKAMQNYQGYILHLAQQDMDMDDEELRKYVSEQIYEIEDLISEDYEYAEQHEGEYGKTLYEDYVIYLSAYSDVSYIYSEFIPGRIEVIEDALYNISDEKAKESPDAYTLRVNEKVAEVYNNKVAVDLATVGDSGFYDAFNGTLWDYILTAFLVLLVSWAFTIDRSSGMHQLTDTSKKGGIHLFVKRFTGVLIFGYSVIIAAAICEFIFAVRFYGCNSLLSPVQVYPKWEMCTLQISVLGFFFLKMACKLIFCTVVCAVATLVAALLKKTWKAMVLSMFITIAPMVFMNNLHTQASKQADYDLYGVCNKLRGFLPSALLDIDKFINKFDYMNFLGFPVFRLAFLIIICVVVIIISLLLGVYTFRRPIKHY